jgi:hypothetical protein
MVVQPLARTLFLCMCSWPTSNLSRIRIRIRNLPQGNPQFQSLFWLHVFPWYILTNSQLDHLILTSIVLVPIDSPFWPIHTVQPRPPYPYQPLLVMLASHLNATYVWSLFSTRGEIQFTWGEICTLENVVFGTHARFLEGGLEDTLHLQLLQLVAHPACVCVCLSRHTDVRLWKIAPTLASE